MSNRSITKQRRRKREDKNKYHYSDARNCPNVLGFWDVSIIT